MKFRINAQLFNATVAAQGKDGFRYYLKGFFLNAERNELVAADGHIMCIAPIEPELGQKDWQECDVPKNGVKTHGWIFGGIQKPLPKAVKEVVIDTEKERIECYGGPKYKGPQFVALHSIDGTYPDYQSVKAKRDPIVKDGVDVVRRFNTEDLYRCFRWAGVPQHGCEAMFIFPKKNTDPVEIHPVGKHCAAIQSLHITLMPCRVE